MFPRDMEIAGYVALAIVVILVLAISIVVNAPLWLDLLQWLALKAA